MPLSPEFRDLYAKLEVPRLDWGKPSGEVIAFAHALVVPAGKHVNTALRLRKFQIEWIRAVYNPADREDRAAASQAGGAVGGAPQRQDACWPR